MIDNRLREAIVLSISSQPHTLAGLPASLSVRQIVVSIRRRATKFGSNAYFAVCCRTRQ